MDEPMNSEEQPKRDIDEVSIASDFSIIPESFCGQEEGSPIEVGATMASGGTSSLPAPNSQLLPSDSSSLTSYGKVIFQNLQATYTADTDIAVSYILTESVVAKSSDRIALYRVGFTSPQDYLGYQWAPTPTKDHTENGLPLTVVFKANNLPKEAGEFFQFCYVTHEGRIVGVSTPLQLLPVGGAGGQVCVLEEEVEGVDSMIIVRTNESVLHDKINKLDKERESLLGDMRKERDTKERMKMELEEKTQQLNMCQHHLQALETKMKKETGEKCELMGRIGQVVEEKGHLEDKLRTLESSLDKTTTKLTALQTDYDRVTVDMRKMEEELLEKRKEREQLDRVLNEIQEQHKTVLHRVAEQDTELKKIQKESDEKAKELEFWTSNAAADQTEKNSLALKYTTVNEELIRKLEELEQSKRENSELEAKLGDCVVELTNLKQRLSEAEEDVKGAEAERDTHRERQEVVSQDNTHLQATIAQLKEKIDQLTASQKREVHGRESAETIASDLSGRLQKARAEYQGLALVNVRLAKKVKKLRAAIPTDTTAQDGLMAASVNSNVSSWLHADVDTDGIITEETVEGNAYEEHTNLGPVTTSEPGVNMVRSCLDSELHSASEVGASNIRTVCTTCTNSTKELSEAVHRKMEDIVKELTQQITLLKSQLHAVTSQLPEQAQEETAIQETTQAEEQAGKQQETVEQAETESQQAEQVQETQETQVAENEASGENVNETDATENATTVEGVQERHVLYGNTFLPTAPTAPVFLHETNTAQRDSPNPSSNPNTQVQAYHAASSGSSHASAGSSHASAQPHYRLPTPQGCSPFLPPPLQPETTATAIQAAVMSQFVGPHNPTHTESDDDDFHSTSDNNDATPLHSTAAAAAAQQQLQVQGYDYDFYSSADISLNTHVSSIRATANRALGFLRRNLTRGNRKLLECPLCNLSFPVTTMRLLEEHINSHLEYVCPVCSVAFQRNCQKKFEEHVHGHFVDEDGNTSDEWTNPLDDPSGPWGRQFRSARLLEID